MPPENFRFGGGAAETILHPIVLVAMLIAIALIFLLPRKYLIVPFLATTFLIPLGQQVLIGGLHFFVYRFIILAFAVRMLSAKFSSPGSVFSPRWSVLDTVFTFWAICRASAVMLLFLQTGAVINQVAFLLDVIGGYFILRFLINDEEGIQRAIRVFAVITFIVASCMLYEKLFVVNVFGFLGGVPDVPEIRNDSVRAQGPFQHSLLAGTFGATLLPLFFLLWKAGKSKVLAVMGAIGATIMVLTSASSTPVLAYGAALGAVFAWPLRRSMQLARWGIVIGLIGLHLVMKAPVWFIIQHIDIVGGSSGYHRAMLVNDFIMHFRDWWLIGTKDNPAWGFSMWDLCNQFVAEGQTGGLITFILFVAMICICFSRIGSARKAVEGDRIKEWYFWLLGCTLFSHVVAYFGISYFDQTRVSWFALLAIILTATAPYMAVKTVEAKRHPLGYRGPKPAYASYSTVRSKAFGALKNPTSLKSRLS